MKRFLPTLLILAYVTAAPALAGPPLLCHAIDIGTARSLPWTGGTSWNGAEPSYDLRHLSDDTLNVLTPQAPIDVRRETLRRAVIYSKASATLADDLATRLLARTTAGGAMPVDATAWFDAGYFEETLREAAAVYPELRATSQKTAAAGVPAGQADGLAWIEKAVGMGRPDMAPAAAFVEAARSMHER